MTVLLGCGLAISSGCRPFRSATVSPPEPPAADSSDRARLNRECVDGDGTACLALGRAFQDGVGGKKNSTTAADKFRMACEAGALEGCLRLGRLHRAGDGVAKDPKRAAALYTKACDGGQLEACSSLGYLYMTGEGAPKDPGKAEQILKVACDGDVAIACGNLGSLLVDAAQAYALHQKACRLGYRASCEVKAPPRVVTADELTGPCDEAPRKEPKSAEAWIEKGECHQEREQFAEAKSALDYALALDPRSHHALFHRATVEADLGNGEPALNDVLAAVELAPKEFEYLQWAAAVAEDLEKSELALSLADRALALQPKDAPTLVTRARALVGVKKPAEAIKAYDAALAVEPDNAAAFHERGHQVWNAGNLEAAEKDFADSLRLDPTVGKIWNDLGQVQSARKRYAEAIKSLDKALELSPTLKAARLSRGIAQYWLGDYFGAWVDISQGVDENDAKDAQTQAVARKKFEAAYLPLAGAEEMFDPEGNVRSSCVFTTLGEQKLSEYAALPNDAKLQSRLAAHRPQISECLASAYAETRERVAGLLQQQAASSKTLAERCSRRPDAKEVCATEQQQLEKLTRRIQSRLAAVERADLTKRAHQELEEAVSLYRELDEDEDEDDDSFY